MSAVDLEDKDGATYSPDVFTRDDAGKTVVIQAVTNVDPTTGAPNASTEATLAELKGVADSLLTAAQAIQAAAAAINGKTTAVNTGDIAGTVGLDAPTLAALETISVAGVATETTLAALNAKFKTQAVDSIVGNNYQKIKMGWGDNGAYLPASGNNPLPVTAYGVTEIVAYSPIPVSGDVTSIIMVGGMPVSYASPMPSTLMVDGNPVGLGFALPVSGEMALDPATISALTTGGGLTDAQLRANPLPTTDTTLADIQTSLHELNETMLYLVNFMVANSPRVDNAGRTTVNPEGTSVVVSTCYSVQNMVNIGGIPAGFGGQDVPLYIYDNIKVV